MKPRQIAPVSHETRDLVCSERFRKEPQDGSNQTICQILKARWDAANCINAPAVEGEIFLYEPGAVFGCPKVSLT